MSSCLSEIIFTSAGQVGTRKSNYSMSKNKIKPLYPYILVEPLPEEKLEGIVMPDTVRKEPNKGTVMAIADGIDVVSAGDRIVWKELSGVWADDLILVDINDILLRF